MLRVGAQVRESNPSLEVLIMVNGEAENSLAQKLLARLEKASWWRIEESSPVGVNRARNRGAELATNPILLFLDDDIQFESPDLLPRMESYAKARQGDWAAGGVYRTALGSGVGQTYGLMQERFQMNVERQTGLPFFMGGFLLMPKELFIRLGGFDEGVVWGGAELALNMKLRAASIHLERPENWSVGHLPQMGIAQLIRKGLRQGLGSQKVPELMVPSSEGKPTLVERIYHGAFYVGLNNDHWRERLLRRPWLLILLMGGATIRLDRFLAPTVADFLEKSFWKIKAWCWFARGRTWTEIDERLRNSHPSIDRRRRDLDFVRQLMVLMRGA